MKTRVTSAFFVLLLLICWTFLGCKKSPVEAEEREKTGRAQSDWTPVGNGHPREMHQGRG